jgi:hypothetical protein
MHAPQHEIIEELVTGIRAGGIDDQAGSPWPDWGVYADRCWNGWPGVVLDWPDLALR